jgi:predicted Zn-dependent protease
MHRDDVNAHILSREEMEHIIMRVRGYMQGGGDIGVHIYSWWNGELKWARNRATLACDRRNLTISIARSFLSESSGTVNTNQVDDASLEAAVRAAERIAKVRSERGRPSTWQNVDAPELPIPNPTIWSAATDELPEDQRGAISLTLMQDAEDRGLFSAGYLEVRAGAVGVWAPKGDVTGKPGWPLDSTFYKSFTQAQCSMTVRHPKGKGSGWAGVSSYDWSLIDGKKLATQALDKCLASLDPVAIEPGRYTAILEPQAVYDMVRFIKFDRPGAEQYGIGPFFHSVDPALSLYRTKLGLKIMDERITIQCDPLDPLLGTFPFPDQRPVTYVERGILKTLSYPRQYALRQLNENEGADGGPGLKISGGTTTIDEMIATTKRGLLVSRLSNTALLDVNTVLLTGVTRDGLWLIENGKITKAVKNMRITESPLFILNQIQELGPPVPVFSPVLNPGIPELTPAIVPPLKVNDFSFTSIVDAI